MIYREPAKPFTNKLYQLEIPNLASYRCAEMLCEWGEPSIGWTNTEWIFWWRSSWIPYRDLQRAVHPFGLRLTKFLGRVKVERVEPCRVKGCGCLTR